MKTKCPVIEDLLPLYVDGVCNEESKRIVEEHLKECMQCNEKYIAQKSAMRIDNNIIKNNLKSKKPFRKIRRYQISLIIILLCTPILFLTLIEVSGDGIGFSALYGKYKTQRFLEQIEEGNFSAAAKHLGFTGGKYGEFNNRDLARKELVAGMEKLREEGIEIIGHDKISIITDDGFTSGYASIRVKYKDLVFYFKLIVSTNTGKVEPMYLTHQYGYEYNEPTETQKMLTEKISEIICTYNPG